MIKIKFLARTFLIKILFFNHYFSPLYTFMRIRKDPDPDPEPYLSGCGGTQKHTDPADPDLEH
jgi:hypothetical protein